MRVYTRTGDRGTTALPGGRRVSKCDPRPEAYGTLDELNVELGALVALLTDNDPLTTEVRRIQRQLFAIGSRLAAPPNSPEQAECKALPSEATEALETSMDRMMDVMPPLKRFVLPGGHSTAVQAHRARTVCRRAERRIVALSEADIEEEGCHQLNKELRYVNRLADYLFVVTRYCNHIRT